MIMIYQYRFVSSNKDTTLVGAVDSEGGCIYAGGCVVNLCHLPLNFSVNLKLLGKKWS